jgi:two-component system sensor histidine kinase ChvG
MRVRAILVVVAVVLAPLGLVAVMGIEERSVGARIAENVRAGAEEASLDPTAANVDAVARRRDLRIRVLDGDEAVVTEADHEAGTNPLASLSTLFFGDDGAPSLRAFDATLGPLGSRPEVRRATASHADVECRTSEGSRLLLCSAARRSSAGLVYAQESSRRPVRALYDLRYELVKMVFILLPAGLLLAWWLGWRTVRPIELLRAQVAAAAAGTRSPSSIDLRRRDEIGDLALAFTGLLRTLDERRRDHEAFVTDLVHEFKNPVAAIRACAEQLEQATPDARTQRIARILDDSGTRLDALVTQFLELARAEGGMHHEARGRVDIAALARGLTDAARADVRWSGVRFVVSAAERANVEGVASRIESALRNLIENAASFAAPGGEVGVAVDVADGAVTVSVRDTGPGITDADLPRVFDRFFTTRGRAHGTGLGLALVKAVAIAHGGDARVESAPGHGATFRFTLPLAR